MSGTGTLTKMTVVEAKLFMRDKAGSLAALLVPIGILIVFGAVGLGNIDPGDNEQNISQAYLPAMVLSLSLAITSMQVFPTILTTYREKGILRRLGTTPVHPSRIIGAQLIVSLGSLIVVLVCVLVISAIFFDVGWPDNWPAFIVSYILSALALLSVGLIVAAVAKNAKAATGIGMLVFFPSLFFAGVWTPGDLLPSWAQPIRDWTPLGATMESLMTSWTGDWPEPKYLIALVLWTVVCSAVAARIFRWE